MVLTKMSALILSASQSHYSIFQRAQLDQPLPEDIKMKQNEKYILTIIINVKFIKIPISYKLYLTLMINKL